MKRDWDLLRSILIDVESCEEALPVVFINEKYKATYGGNHYLEKSVIKNSIRYENMYYFLVIKILQKFEI